jgi:hypothetical protein
MTSLKRELYDTFQSLVNDRDQLRLEIAQAQETISILETEINAIKFHGDAAFAKMADKLEVTRHTFELVTESTSDSYWLKDIWLSDAKSATLLGEAEAAWRENISNPQQALDIVERVFKRVTNKCERIKCNLFVSAVMLAIGKTEEACASANEALHQCGDDFNYKHLAGIAHYLRGRVFLEIQSFRQAYWDLSLAVFTPCYHERAKHFQQYTENRLLHEDKQERISTRIIDGSNDQILTDTASDQRPSLKLAPEMQAPMDEFMFEKVNITPISGHKDL